MRRTKERIIKWVLGLCALITLLTTVGIILVLLIEAINFFEKVSIFEFLGDTQWTPLFANKHYGIWPLLSGTFLTTLIAMCVALPIGLTIAVYLNEYASVGFRKIIKPALEILAVVPTVVYGFFALMIVTPFLDMFISDLSGFNALSAGLVMGIMITRYRYFILYY